MSGDKWYFNSEQLINTPSRRHGYTREKEESYMLSTANFIQDLGRKLTLPLLCINTAVLYMQRFYMYHPLNMFEWHGMGAAALFLAAKVEEHPRKIEHILHVARNLGMYRDKSIKDSTYTEDLLFNENVLLTTLGFDLQVQHPHQHILRMSTIDMTILQTAYVLATYCLHLTRMCLVYKPFKIACMCVYIASKMDVRAISPSNAKKFWEQNGEETITEEILKCLSAEFDSICGKCPEKHRQSTLLTIPEHFIRKFVNSLHDPKRFSLTNGPDQEISCSQNLVTLHDDVKKLASSKKFTPLSGLETTEVSIDEKYHDPHKHSRKMNPTPKKNKNASLPKESLPMVRYQNYDLSKKFTKVDHRAKKVAVDLIAKSDPHKPSSRGPAGIKPPAYHTTADSSIKNKPPTLSAHSHERNAINISVTEILRTKSEPNFPQQTIQNTNNHVVMNPFSIAELPEASIGKRPLPVSARLDTHSKKPIPSTEATRTDNRHRHSQQSIQSASSHFGRRLVTPYLPPETSARKHSWPSSAEVHKHNLKPVPRTDSPLTQSINNSYVLDPNCIAKLLSTEVQLKPPYSVASSRAHTSSQQNSTPSSTDSRLLSHSLSFNVVPRYQSHTTSMTSQIPDQLKTGNWLKSETFHKDASNPPISLKISVPRNIVTMGVNRNSAPNDLKTDKYKLSAYRDSDILQSKPKRFKSHSLE